MQAQDSSDPTGVRQVTPHPGRTGAATETVVARNRKANAAVQLRLAGATWTEIAEALGFPTPRQAMVATERALVKQLESGDDRERMRKMAGARLERLLRSLWTKAIDPDHPEHLIAASRAREVIDRHAKLFGLDAPTEYVVHTPTTTELEAWVARVAGAGAAMLAQADVIDAEEIEEDEPRALSAG